MDFLGANRQFDWMEISLVYDKSDKRTTIYNSYNVQMASKRIKSVRFTKFTKIYSLTNEKKYDIHNLTQKHLFTSSLWPGAVMGEVWLPSVII